MTCVDPIGVHAAYLKAPQKSMLRRSVHEFAMTMPGTCLGGVASGTRVSVIKQPEKILSGIRHAQER